MQNANNMKQTHNFSKVWGIGLPRTGTTTLINALNILGYHGGKPGCFHNLHNHSIGADIGVYGFWKYIDYIHPGSKFILTTRNINKWLDSVEFLINAIGNNRYEDHTHDWAALSGMNTFWMLEFDKDNHTRAFYRFHNDIVTYFTGREKDFLIIDFESGDSWPELCSFLGLPIPKEKFPHRNKR